MTFAFTDAQWQPIAVELSGIGRLGGDRRSLEFVCGIFIQSRPRVGKGLPTPKKAREAWLKVADAADALDNAIKGLREASAADFTMLDDHSDRIFEWMSALPSLARGAREAAEYEIHEIKPTANNADPVRDFFLSQIITIWHEYGGAVRASTDPSSHREGGPLVRFVSAVMAPVFAKLNEAPPTPGMIRSAVREHRLRQTA